MKNDKQVGVILRGVAWVFDWYLCGVFAAVPISVLWMNINPDLPIQNGLNQFSNPYSYIAGIIAIIVCIFYYVIIPHYCWKGQTIAKKTLNIKIVKNDGTDVTFIDIFKRQILCLFFIDAYLTASTLFISQMIGLLFNNQLSQYFEYYLIIMTLISVGLVIFSRKKLSIHDLLSKTKVINIAKG